MTYLALNRAGVYNRQVIIRDEEHAQELFELAQHGDTLHRLDALLVEQAPTKVLMHEVDEQLKEGKGQRL